MSNGHGYNLGGVLIPPVRFDTVLMDRGTGQLYRLKATSGELALNPISDAATTDRVYSAFDGPVIGLFTPPTQFGRLFVRDGQLGYDDIRSNAERGFGGRYPKVTALDSVDGKIYEQIYANTQGELAYKEIVP